MSISPGAVGIGFAASLLSAVFVHQRKICAAYGSTAFVNFAIFLPYFVCCLIYGAVTRPEWPGVSYLLPFAGSFLCWVAMNNLITAALRQSPVSVVMPVTGAMPAVTALLGVVFLEESLSFLQILGVVLVFPGLLWLYASPDHPFSLRDMIRQFVRQKGAPAMAGAVLFWAVAMMFDKKAVQASSVEFHIIAVIAALFGYYAVQAGRERKWPRLSTLRMLALGGTGLGFFTGYILQLYAISLVPLGLYETIKRLVFQFYGVIVGSLVHKEPLTVPKIIGSAVLIVSVLLVLR